ncbi:19537_t:CDS:1, partial [Racocetra persica]
IENRKTELIKDMKAFETLVKIITNNIENDKLYEVYTALKKPLIVEIAAYNKVLNAKTQQQTWNKSKIGKLAFWLQ